MKSLRGLGPQAKSLVLAELKEFRKDWWDGWSNQELYDVWDYKPVSNNDICKQWEVRQIKFRKDYRVLFTLIEAQDLVHLLDAYGKTSEQLQNAAIKRACARARTIWEDRGGRLQGR